MEGGDPLRWGIAALIAVCYKAPRSTVENHSLLPISGLGALVWNPVVAILLDPRLYSRSWSPRRRCHILILR